MSATIFRAIACKELEAKSIVVGNNTAGATGTSGAINLLDSTFAVWKMYNSSADLYLEVGSGDARTITLRNTSNNGLNISFADTTGTKLGTSTSQKMAFWGVTPVVQQVLATGTSATVDDVISLLQTLGLCKQS